MAIPAEVLILPVTARDEEWSPTTQESTFNYVRLSDSGIKFNTIIYEEQDSYRQKAGRDAIFLNREDMAKFGLADGARITLCSDRGRMVGTATAFDLPRGSALAYYPEANVLCGTAVDPRSHTPAFKSVPVWIEH